jgi:hypothetical protein
VELALVAETDSRSEGRSNVFLTAALNLGSSTVAVRIRNLSVHGALVEASSLPPVGSHVTLIRGQLQVAGELAWQGAGQGGINFSKSIDVGRWVKHVGHGGQHRVDGVLAALRGSGALPSELPTAQSLETVVSISGALDQVCEDLAGTSNLSIELAESLLRLDSIAQALRRLATGKPF